MSLEKQVLPNKSAFEADPLGYGALGWHKWGAAQTLAGFPIDLLKGPDKYDLKDPVLWLSHAHAMSEAARVILEGNPNIEVMPKTLRGVTHCQYHAVALMLVGYSLEICLKAMLIIKKGIAVYQTEEKQYFKHDLAELAEFVPELSVKDKAILTGLTHYVKWAGRYPDPGFSRLGHADEIFQLSERYQISAKDLFALAARVMNYSRVAIA